MNEAGYPPLNLLPQQREVQKRMDEECRGANARQVGGEHYKHKYEPWDVILDWGLGYLDGNVVKYVSRWRYKYPTKEKRIEDLKKARHYLDKLIEEESK